MEKADPGEFLKQVHEVMEAAHGAWQVIALVACVCIFALWMWFSHRETTRSGHPKMAKYSHWLDFVVVLLTIILPAALVINELHNEVAEKAAEAAIANENALKAAANKSAAEENAKKAAAEAAKAQAEVAALINARFPPTKAVNYTFWRCVLVLPGEPPCKDMNPQHPYPHLELTVTIWHQNASTDQVTGGIPDALHISNGTTIGTFKENWQTIDWGNGTLWRREY
jgi:hypothetical protein